MTKASTIHTACLAPDDFSGASFGGVAGGAGAGAGGPSLAGPGVAEPMGEGAVELATVGAFSAILNLSSYSHRSSRNGGLGQQFHYCFQQHREIQRFLQYRAGP